MDAYFRPTLISALIVIILNTILIIPVFGAPLMTYFLGGVLAVLFYRNDTKALNKEIKASDVSILGMASGILVGSILTLIITFKLRNPEMKQLIIDTINQKMQMQSQNGFALLNDLGPVFYLITAIMIIFVCSLVSLFGALSTLPFISKGKK